MTSIDSSINAIDKVLEGLNANQRKAVTAPSNARLQIIAGPGTGKTKVLTSRVAYLLLNEHINPQHIIVTTFTKKAALEMMERLEKNLVGQSVDLSKLLIGTFHSICYRIIKIYGKKIGIEDYHIADERDSNQILKEVMENLSDNDRDLLAGVPEDEKLPLQNPRGGADQKFDIKKVKRQISKLKSSGVSYDNYASMNDSNRVVSLFYRLYQTKLEENSLLDFDDCLFKCLDLITSHPVLNFVQHVLVDEFQDSNEIQLQLMYNFARGHPTIPKLQNNVTIVGDPDQSIYGFRDAQAINFEKMNSYYKQKYGKSCEIIHLVENYRSTSDILSLSETVMRQQQTRTQKSLKSQHTTTFKPVYKNLNSSEEEALWISYHIQHLLALPDSPLKYSDFSILVRAAYQTRVIENELVKKRIPYHMIRGRAFWERSEVIAILDYLRVIAHDNDRIAFIRSLNFPKRGFGPKTLESLSQVSAKEAATSGISIYETLKGVLSGEISGVKLNSKNKSSLKDYLGFLEQSREMLANLDTYLNGEVIEYEKKSDLLAKFFKFVFEKSGLAKEYVDEDNQTLNVMEVEKQFREFTPQEVDLPLFIGGTEDDIAETKPNFLSSFIQSIGLYEADAAASETDKSKGKVSVSTIHGSKGLEWNVVFVPGLSEGLLPAGFAIAQGGEELVDEERRCFYVATTRAKSLLYLSSYTTSAGNFYGRSIDKVSRFIEKLNNHQLLGTVQEAFKDWNSLMKLYQILDKNPIPVPDKKQFCIDTFNSLLKSRIDIYMQGIPLSIKQGDFVAGANINTYSNTNMMSSGMGFSSAKLDMNIPKRSVGLWKRQVKPKHSPNTTTTSNNLQFKPPMMNKAPVCNRQFAPPTVQGVNMNIKKSINNKAPPYIPDRRKK
ncbi:hypothetical protein DFJ63DRAFT_103201 [Scheffersomyces coipomensis]|uniref:uncharacterized protein n=1 Tax=Scheffersomyces coipomensis TaxID=1788519 RepID=UPI00315DBBCA